MNMKWNKLELKLLVNEYVHGGATAKVIAAQLGRARSSVEAKIRNLKLRHSKPGKGGEKQ
ncbi:hypothetical protein EQG49_12685 [Periweissella cryptocerci]|uniref:Uncharacterized protein n=1 Tax=Periweissella cryptocerci TaxID=2506420 RepID=A0A4P6YWP2_9LACO|nr:hypothetical protein [Periweissella cryptocerci]QBO37254.1 hypothetical protein EQG49_12685 [Periweissella cryptocerci]